MNKITIISGIVIIALSVGISAYVGPTERVTERVVEQVGAQSGPDHFETQRFFEGFRTGFNSVATSTAGGVSSITAISQIINCDNPYVSWTANLNQTVTLQASTSPPFSGMRAGESCSILVYSATTTAATTITWAAGTGIDLQEDEGATVVQNGLEIARLTFVKKADTDVIAWVEVGQVGD
tara:strand:- start:572 stop:1114 length:543 start_codon:yes stop_codon:yes gene_type:complete